MADPHRFLGPTPVHVEDLPDGSWLADLRQRHSAAARAAEPMRVRIIDYTLDDGRENATSYRLFTTVLDPSQASATDLAAAYAQRWEIESTFDELKTHQRGPRTVLRSKSPDLVLQEIWGHLCCHFAIRSLMAQAATHAGHDPDRVSFVAALRITRQTLAHPGIFSLTSKAETAPAGWTSYTGYCNDSTPRDDAEQHPRHQKEIHQVARQTSHPRHLAPTRQHHNHPNPTLLTERY